MFLVQFVSLIKCSHHLSDEILVQNLRLGMWAWLPSQGVVCLVFKVWKGGKKETWNDWKLLKDWKWPGTELFGLHFVCHVWRKPRHCTSEKAEVQRSELLHSTTISGLQYYGVSPYTRTATTQTCMASPRALKSTCCCSKTRKWLSTDCPIQASKAWKR